MKKTYKTGPLHSQETNPRLTWQAKTLFSEIEWFIVARNNIRTNLSNFKTSDKQMEVLSFGINFATGIQKANIIIL